MSHHRRSESATERQRRVWDTSAPGYDKQMAFFEKVWFTGGREWVCSRATGRVLEVAVGTGRNLPFYPAEVELTGIDLSPRMLEIARERLAGLGREAVLLEGDAEELPFAADTFDTVVCALGLCSIPDDARAVGEMARVLRPGGRLLLLDHVGSTFAPLRWAQRWVETASVRLAGEHFTRRQLAHVQAAGLDVVETDRIAVGTVERVHAVKR
jgi:ubiquinone/menaquinone biosynthesis C-methylase UbiE